MELTGIKKEIDELGRLQIPKDIRKAMGLNGEVEMIMTVEGLLVRSCKYKLVKNDENKK